MCNRGKRYSADEVVEILRGAIEHRATWMGLMCREFEKRGEEWEPAVRKAVSETGVFHGERLIDSLNGEVPDMRQFAKEFLSPFTKRNFDIKIEELTEERLKVEFHYCALVKGWKKQGISDEKIETLCDIAMEGDRAIAKAAGLKFQLGKTIAKGDDRCQLCFSRS